MHNTLAFRHYLFRCVVFGDKGLIDPLLRTYRDGSLPIVRVILVVRSNSSSSLRRLLTVVFKSKWGSELHLTKFVLSTGGCVVKLLQFE